MPKRSTTTKSRSKKAPERYVIDLEVTDKKVDKLIADAKQNRTDREYLELQSRAAARLLYDLRHLVYRAIECNALRDDEGCLATLDDLDKMVSNAKLQVSAFRLMLLTAKQKDDKQFEDAIDAAKGKKIMTPGAWALASAGKDEK